jgi:hypothetical protein
MRVASGLDSISMSKAGRIRLGPADGISTQKNTRSPLRVFFVADARPRDAVCYQLALAAQSLNDVGLMPYFDCCEPISAL